MLLPAFQFYVVQSWSPHFINYSGLSGREMKQQSVPQMEEWQLSKINGICGYWCGQQPDTNFLVLTMQCINFCFSSETTPGKWIPGEGVSASREPALGKAFLTLLSRTDLYKRLWEWCVEIFTQVEAVIHTSGITQYSLQCFQKVMPNNMENICIPRDKIEIIAGVRSLQPNTDTLP